jgi:hypothetical protein
MGAQGTSHTQNLSLAHWRSPKGAVDNLLTTCGQPVDNFLQARIMPPRPCQAQKLLIARIVPPRPPKAQESCQVRKNNIRESTY